MPQPRKPSGGIMLLGTATLLGALLATLFAWLLYTIDCHEESYSVCSKEGRAQLGLALVGLAVSFGTLVASVRGGPKPGISFVATILIYATWVLFIFTLEESA